MTFRLCETGIGSEAEAHWVAPCGWQPVTAVTEDAPVIEATGAVEVATPAPSATI